MATLIVQEEYTRGPSSSLERTTWMKNSSLLLPGLRRDKERYESARFQLMMYECLYSVKMFTFFYISCLAINRTFSV